MGHPRNILALVGSLAVLAALSACTTEPKPATALSFTVQPSDGTAGEVITPAIEVGFIDSDRTPVTSGIQADITLTLSSGPGGGTLTGTATRPTINGVATFDDLAVTPAGAGWTLTATEEVTPCDPQAVECTDQTDFPPKTSDGFNMDQ